MSTETSPTTSRVCDENFRHFARHLIRVKSSLCVTNNTSHGAQISEMLGYYDELDWDLGKYYLVKTIIKGYIVPNYLEFKESEYGNLGIVSYFELNYTYDAIVNFYRILHDLMSTNPCCMRHLVWDKTSSITDTIDDWPEPELSLDDDMDISPYSSSTDDEEYWNCYDNVLDTSDDYFSRAFDEVYEQM